MPTGVYERRPRPPKQIPPEILLRLPEPPADARFIPLTKGAVALVDAEDYERLSAFNWYLHSAGYAAARSKPYTEIVYMHRMLLPGCEEVDHINHNGCDNRKGTLRAATRTDNAANIRMRAHNTSGFRGVSRDGWGRWKAEISINARTLWLGTFADPIEAACIFNAVALHQRGPFARLNRMD